MYQPITTPTAPGERVPEATSAPSPEADIPTILARMAYAERVRAYRRGVFSSHELSVSAAHDPDSMPILNGEFEWIAINLE